MRYIYGANGLVGVTSGVERFRVSYTITDKNTGKEISKVETVSACSRDKQLMKLEEWKDVKLT